MIIVSNWKAIVEDIKTARRLVEAAQKVTTTGKHKVILAPPFPFIAELARTKSKLFYAGQDLSVTDGGSQTGEVTGVMLKSSGASYVLIGHSERRARGETDRDVATKVKSALAAGLTPIVCVGERKRDADAQYLSFVRTQLQAVYGGLKKNEIARIMLAYEPVWAIGKSAASALSPGDLVEMVGYIRKIIAQYVPQKVANQTLILYGGSVDGSNVHALTEGTGVVGVLVGRASTDPKSFLALAKALGSVR